MYMEQKGLGNSRQTPYFPATYSPEAPAKNLFMYSFARNFFPESGFVDAPQPQTPNSLYPSYDQTLESAFSRISLSSDRQTAPFLAPETGYFRAQDLNNNVGFHEQGGGLMLGFDDQYHQTASGGGGHQQQQDFGFGGAHRNLLVGPGNWGCGPGVSGFSGGGSIPWYAADESAGGRFLNADLKNTDNSHQRFVGDHGYSPFLQRKQSLTKRVSNNAQLPNFPDLLLPCSNYNGYNGVSIESSNLDGLSNGILSENLCFLRQNNRQLYSKIKNQLDGLSLKDMRGGIISLAKDQSGSKILQARVDCANEGEIEMAISELLDHVSDLMKNQASCYFIQKLFVVCNEEQRTRIIMAVTKNSFQLVEICLNPNGARTTQKLLENLSTPEQVSCIITALSPGAVALANDPNGQHVIRYCLIHYPYEYHKLLLNEILRNCYAIATDKSGCCVLQQCVENSYGEPKERLMNEIIRNALQLAEDPYGNYVVQHLLGLKIQEATSLLLEQLQGHFVALSSDKYASNVVEKILVESGKEHSTTVIMELLTSPNAGSLLVHPYGNFVIQKALSIAKGEVYLALHNLIQSNAKSMQNNLFGRKILAWFEKKKHQYV